MRQVSCRVMEVMARLTQHMGEAFEKGVQGLLVGGAKAWKQSSVEQSRKCIQIKTECDLHGDLHGFHGDDAAI